jgi:hypothetical protein
MTFDIKVSMVQQRKSRGRAAGGYNDQTAEEVMSNTRFSKKKIKQKKKNDQKVEEELLSM